MKKINISKEDLIKLYCENQYTTETIAQIYKVNRTTISNRLKEYSILVNTNQRKFQSRKNISLSEKQISLIIGSSLGDASIILSGRRINAYFKVSHCEKQLEYVEWKKEILGTLSSEISKYIDKRGNSIMYNLYTLSHPKLNIFRELFYNDHIKIIKLELENYLTPLSLAIWFMDDGNKNRISTDGFSKDDNYLLQNIIKNKFELEVNVLKYNRNNKDYYYLSFDKNNIKKLNNIIEPFMIKSMKYKLNN
jgi:hypothetical protein